MPLPNAKNSHTAWFGAPPSTSQTELWHRPHYKIERELEPDLYEHPNTQNKQDEHLNINSIYHIHGTVGIYVDNRYWWTHIRVTY